jgi:GNAT superfamily N-acetyltransferase
MENWTLRRADTGDADGLGRCFDAAYAQYAERIDDLPPMSENCAEEIAKNLVWVAEAKGTIVGGLVLVPSDGFLLLANVAVRPDNRGTGLGQRLLMLAETEAMDRGYAEMRLNTHADMPEILRLYERNGWLQESRRGKTIKMKKDLPRS